MLPAHGDTKATAAGASATFTGWGSTAAQPWPVTAPVPPESFPDRLRAAPVTFVTDARCAKRYDMPEGHVDGINIDGATMACASGQTAAAQTVGSCYGDSGGPLFRLRPNGRVVQVGVVSFGKGCAQPRYPSVFAELAEPSINKFVRQQLRR